MEESYVINTITQAHSVGLPKPRHPLVSVVKARDIKPVIDKAKTILLNSSSSICEIAYTLGFEYPQHFSNLFKSKTGISPIDYRKLN